jgi:hypothetical protein
LHRHTTFFSSHVGPPASVSSPWRCRFREENNCMNIFFSLDIHFVWLKHLFCRISLICTDSWWSNNVLAEQIRM